MTTRTQRSASRVGTLALLAGLTACGGEGDPDQRVDGAAGPGSPGAGSTVEPSAPEAAYREWLTAVEDHDAAATCSLHAPELTIELRQQAILEGRAEPGDPCPTFVALLWEDPTREYDASAIEPTQVTDEDALLAVDFPEVDQTVTMTYWHGGWHVADTSPRTSGSGDVDRWLMAWCDLAVDMGRDQVVARMGAPSGEYTVANGGEPQLWWTDRQYDFRAYLDPAGRVLDLVGDYDRLSGEDRAVLTCPELR